MSKTIQILFCVLVAVFCAEGSPLVQNPPNPFAVEKMARYIMHNVGKSTADFYSISNLLKSHQQNFATYPMNSPLW